MENYFEFYDLEVKFMLDQDELRNRYLKLSKQHHPDFFIDQDEAYENALEMTSLNNKAFKVLSSQEQRVKHILELNELLTDAKESMSPDFLMQMMDINEAIMEMKMDPDGAQKAKVLKEVEEFESDLDSEFQTAAQLYDTSGDPSTLHTIKDNFLKRRYLRRMKENLV